MWIELIWESDFLYMEPKEITEDIKDKAIEIESLKNLLQRNFTEIENI